MTKTILSAICVIFLLTSCDKSYKYVETVNDVSLFGGTIKKDKDPDIIKAPDDTSAYLEAFQRFCISVKVNKDMNTSLGSTYSTPLNFKLFDDKGQDIVSTVSFENKDKREKEIADKIFSLKNTIQESVDNSKKEKEESFKQVAIIDSSKINELSKYFRRKKDEYSNENKIWYEPKSSPNYTNANGLYCYFNTENGMPSNLRFRLQYYADDWLFFKTVNFSIDGKAYKFIPKKTETDSGNGGYIWEWFDESIIESDKELIQALANAKNAKMKLEGRQYYKEKTITQEQIIGIKRTIDLYKAMGGQF